MAKGFLIGDVHLGLHQLELDKWYDISKDYFFNYFIPFIETNANPGDKIFILGDLFDNRSHIDLKTLNLSLDIFDKLEENGIEVIIMAGNHDLWANHDYEFNTLRFLKKYTNIRLVFDPEVYEIDDKKILLLPWITDKNKEKEVLSKYAGKIDYLFCHSELKGAKSNLKNPVGMKHGTSLADYAMYPKVYAAHIHIRQVMENFMYIGNPFHMDRNDINNKKGITILDIPSGVDKFYENNMSPEFTTYEINTEEDALELKNILENKEKEDFVDLVVKNSVLIKNPEIKKTLQKIAKTQKIEKFHQVDDIKVEDTVGDIELDSVGTTLDVVEFIRTYVTRQEYDSDLKDDLTNLLDELVTIAKKED